MTKGTLAVLLVLTFVLAPLAQAQEKSSPSQVHDWQGLRDLKPGKAIIVYTRQGKEFAGKFADINGGILGLALGATVLDFEQSDIAEVRQKTSRKKGRIIGEIIGTLAGALVAAGIAVKTEQNGTVPQETLGFGAGMLGMVGGGSLGYAIGLQFDNKRKGKLLYKSP